MTRPIYLASLALCGLAACDGPGDEPLDQDNVASAPARAEEGRLSIKGPGIDFAINVPEGVQQRARVGGDNDIMPPGASVGGLHIQGDGGNQSAGEDSVELRFHADAPVAQIVAWYRDPARKPHLHDVEARREGADTILSGRTGERGGGRFRVRLAAGRSGGTDGRLTLIDGN